MQQVLRRFLPARMDTSSDMEKFVPSKFHNPEESTLKRKLIRSYLPPSRIDMLVILPFFNPCNSIRITQNLLFVKQKLESSGIPFVVAHCLFPDSVPLSTQSNSTYFTVHSTSYAFVKENLANLAITRCGASYSKYTILDADVIFDTLTWYYEVSKLLDAFDVVQPYTKYCNLDSNYFTILKEGNALFEQVAKDPTGYGHPGYAISFTHQFWETHGYADVNVIGGGDTLFCSLVLKRILFDNPYYNKIYEHHVKNDIDVKVSYHPGTVYHLYHNHVINRNYMTRYTILDKYLTEGQGVQDIIEKNRDGVWEWKRHLRTNLNRDILNFFASRQDDEIHSLDAFSR